MATQDKALIVEINVSRIDIAELYEQPPVNFLKMRAMVIPLSNKTVCHFVE
jgi:hypothetical protein